MKTTTHPSGGFSLFVCGNFFKRFQRIEPETIICHHTPFPEMQGDIIYVDYERSSWKYMDDEKLSPKMM